MYGLEIINAINERRESPKDIVDGMYGMDFFKEIFDEEPAPLPKVEIITTTAVVVVSVLLIVILFII